jgi:integrase/recombinase XerC/integrase/recombinase XerD
VAREAETAARDLAIIKFLLDTGVRASELCGINVCDLDFDNRRVRVLGKGNKERTVSFGETTAEALLHYLHESRRPKGVIPSDPKAPLFCSIKGRSANTRLTRSGVLDMIRTVGKSAGITGVRCSPHTFRHTFATRMIMQGVPAFTVKEMLGHTDLTMTNQYVQLAQSDVEKQFRANSLVDRLPKS